MSIRNLISSPHVRLLNLFGNDGVPGSAETQSVCWGFLRFVRSQKSLVTVQYSQLICSHAAHLTAQHRPDSVEPRNFLKLLSTWIIVDVFVPDANYQLRLCAIAYCCMLLHVTTITPTCQGTFHVWQFPSANANTRTQNNHLVCLVVFRSMDRKSVPYVSPIIEEMWQ